MDTNTAYQMIIIAIPVLFGFIFTIIGAFLGENTLIRLRRLIDVIRNWGKPHVDDPQDMVIKWSVANFDITSEDAIKTWQAMLDGMASKPPKIE